MVEFPVDVLWAIKSMFLRSIWNPNAFKYSINALLYVYKYVIIIIFLSVILLFILKCLYRYFKKTKDNKKKTKISIQETKKIILEESNVLKFLKYPLIWSILVFTSWPQVSIIFYLFSKYYQTQGDIIQEQLPTQEAWVLWIWASMSVIFFIIGWCSIWLSFWNKTLRNIWIIIYTLWVLFILFGLFLSNWVISNGLSNFIV
jgi:hypothetical protein